MQDWSWAQTKRRLTTLYRLARPYRLRTALAIVFLLGATGDVARAAAPDRARRQRGERRQHRRADVDRRRVRRRRASSGSPARTGRPTSPAGRASACSPTCATTSSGTCSGCRSASTSAPRRGARQPDHERRRGARPARHRRRHLARPELADADRHRGDHVRPRLAARARDADRRAGARSPARRSSAEVVAQLPPRARKAQPRHGDARRGHRGHARPAGVHARAGRARELRRR